jgi:hypothetical protein
MKSFKSKRLKEKSAFENAECKNMPSLLLDRTIKDVFGTHKSPKTSISKKYGKGLETFRGAVTP